jgi:hypothetical protein
MGRHDCRLIGKAWASLRPLGVNLVVLTVCRPLPVYPD